jgi:hypothetical protein
MARASVGVSWALALGVAGALAGGGGVWLGTRQVAGSSALLVSSRPSRATVDVDSRLTAPGHGSVARVVTLDRDGRVALDVELPSLERSLTVQTIPSGARVFVDGDLSHQRTPVTVRLGQDDFHELRVELDGYGTQTRAVKPEDHEPTLTLHLEPEQQERGTLWVEGPPSTQVYIDGAPTGFFAPTVGMPIAIGAHTVELRDSDGAVRAQRSVSIKRGEVVHVALEPPMRPASSAPPRR